MRLPGSFRDPEGSLYIEGGTVYRQMSSTYRENYDCLMNSGLYDTLTDLELLIPHEEVSANLLRPELLPFISYPYEWCFSQLKDAALTTLEIQKTALRFGMTLKDASAYNIQFRKGRPILIDTLSFEKYREGEPWRAYKQFCEHFLAPLALMSCRDVRLNQLSRVYIDGIPLDLASSLLPLRARLKFSLFAHIYLHSKFQNHYADKPKSPPSMSPKRLNALTDNLKSTIEKLNIKMGKYDYYKDTNYSVAGFEHKKTVVEGHLSKLKSSVIWDLGANIGEFSRVASADGALVVAIDNEHDAVETNYLRGETNILPLIIDLANPSPDIGWANSERTSLIERGPADTVLMLALIHHLAITNNVPLDMVAEFLNSVCRRHLVVEFVPKSDSQVQRLLATRDDVFRGYTQEHFEAELGKHFKTLDTTQVMDSHRTLYLMEKI